MSKIIISDTSCLIALSNIYQLDLLKELFNHIYITKEVKSEFGAELPEWIITKGVNSVKFQKELEQKLDVGEASSIALAKELVNAVLIIDETKGRRIAESYNIEIIGTIGVLVMAYKERKITNLHDIFNQLIVNGFRVSNKIIKLVIDKLKD